jgi:ribosomal subunit interface protein
MELKIRKDFIVAGLEDNLSEYINDLLEDKVVVVEENGNYKGVLLKRTILRWKLDPSKSKVKYFVKKMQLMKKNELEDLKVIDYMLNNLNRFVLVGANNKVKGYVYIDDIILKNIDKIKDLEVREIMQKDYPTIEENEPVSKAFHLMKYNNVDRLIVLDKDHNLAGLITLSDVLKALVKPYEKPTKGTMVGEKIHEFRRPVKEFMKEHPLVIYPDTLLKDAFNKMLKADVNSLIVVKKGDPTTAIGLLSKRSILIYLKALIKKEEELSITFSLHNVELDDLDKEWIKNKFRKILKKFGGVLRNYSVHIDIKKVKEHIENELDRYLVRIHLIIPGKMFLVDVEGESMILALNRTFKILERQLLRYKEELSEKEVSELLKELESYYV